MASSTQFLHSSLPLLPNHRPRYNLHTSLSFVPPKPSVTFPCNPQSLRHFPLVRAALASSSSSTLSSDLPLQASQTSSPEILSGSTRTLASVFALALSLSRVFANLVQKIPLPVPGQLVAIIDLQRNSILTAGPFFFASLRDRPAGSLNTPLTVVAAGLAKWLDIYSGVLMVRVLLSWFPNIPWERQPLSAIRDLCDPYLNLFRNIIPPVFDTLDVSPLLAFAILGTLGTILHGSSG